MQDGSAVVHGIMAKANQNPKLESMIKQEYGKQLFDDWQKLFHATEEANSHSEQLAFF